MNPVSLGEHLLRKRRQLGLIQREVAAAIGVKVATYLTWEMGRRQPSIRLWPRLLDYLGYDPLAPAETCLVAGIEATRRRLGWTNSRLASFIGIDQGTWSRWQTGRGTPIFPGDRLDEFLALENTDVGQLGEGPAGSKHWTLGDHLLRQRERLTCSQRQAAREMHITPNCLRKWERNLAAPGVAYWPALLLFLGYDPTPLPTTAGEQIEKKRRLLGWTYKRIAKFVGVAEHTIIRWTRLEVLNVARSRDLTRLFDSCIAGEGPLQPQAEMGDRATLQQSL